MGNVYKNPLKPGVRYFAGAVVYFIVYAIFELPVWMYYANKGPLVSVGQMFTDMSGDFLNRQFIVLLGGILIFAGVWILTFARAAKQFEKYDL